MRLLAIASLASLCLLVSSSASAQMPGGFLGPPCFTTFELREGTTDLPLDERIGPTPLPCPVFAGYVVLLDNATGSQDPRNWSDVVAFTTGGPVQPGQPTDHVFFISDSVDPATNTENGITAADLAVAGLNPAEILANPTTVFLVEGQNTLAGKPDANVYTAAGSGPVPAQYILTSDPPTEQPVPTLARTWGRVKALYH
jgi:hypothetical protein